MAEKVRLNDFSIDNINIPAQIRELIGGKGFDWLPQFGQTVVGTKGNESVHFQIPYKEPPIVVVSALAAQDPKLEPLSYQFKPIQIVLEPIALPPIKGVQMQVPAVEKASIQLPKFEIDDIKKIEIPDLEFIAKKIELTLKQSLAELSTIAKSELAFPLPPKIGAWNVAWHKMTSPGVYGTALVEVDGNVIKNPAQLPDDGISSVSSGIADLPAVDGGVFEITEVGTGTSTDFTDADLADGVVRTWQQGEVTFEENTDGSVTVTRADGGQTIILGQQALDVKKTLSQDPNANVDIEDSDVVVVKRSEPPTGQEPLDLRNQLSSGRIMLSPDSPEPQSLQKGTVAYALRRIKVNHLGLKQEAMKLGDGASTDFPKSKMSGTNFDRKAGQFTGMFDFDFGEDGVFGGQGQKIGFKSQAEFDVEDTTKIFLLAGGAEGFRVWINSTKVIDKFGQRDLPTQEIVSFTLDQGTYIITFEWWTWDTKTPAAFIQTVPPLVPKEIGKVQFDLENAMELANLNAWNFMRDQINELYDELLPVWEIGIPEVEFPKITLFNGVNFTVEIKKIKVAGKTVYSGKKWELKIPKLEIKKFKLLKSATITLDTAAPFISANTAIFNLTNIFPRWFGRYQGREVGKHISAGLNALGGVVQGAFDFAVGSVKSLNQYINAQIGEFETKVNESISGLTKSVNEAMGANMGEIKDKFESTINEVAGELTTNTNALSKVLGTEVESTMNTFKNTLVTKLEGNMGELTKSIETGVAANVNSAVANLKTSMEKSVNDTLELVVQELNKKIDSGFEQQRKLIESQLNLISKEMTSRFNGVLASIVPEIYKSLGLPEGFGMVQATPMNITPRGFILPANRHGMVVNWFAIGIPASDEIASEAVNILDF